MGVDQCWPTWRVFDETRMNAIKKLTRWWCSVRTSGSSWRQLGTRQCQFYAKEFWCTKLWNNLIKWHVKILVSICNKKRKKSGKENTMGKNSLFQRPNLPGVSVLGPVLSSMTVCALVMSWPRVLKIRPAHSSFISFIGRGYPTRSGKNSKKSV